MYMQQHLQKLETSLDDAYKKAPPLPKGGKDFLVDALPWLSLLGGIVSLWAAWGLWHWARTVNALADYANNLSAAFGVDAPVATNRLTVSVWLALIVMAVTALLYLAAFSLLKDRKKKGWDLLFYAALLNVVYGLVMLFTDYGGLSTFIGYVIGTAIGLYFLFQVRSGYTGAKVPSAPSKPA
jgi:hypothetical protein